MRSNHKKENKMEFDIKEWKSKINTLNQQFLELRRGL